MKAIFFLFALFSVLLLSGTNAEELPQEPTGEDLPENPVQPRITCDLLSWGGFNHSLCAAHCLFKGYKGGYCNEKAICVCRN